MSFSELSNLLHQAISRTLHIKTMLLGRGKRTKRTTKHGLADKTVIVRGECGVFENGAVSVEALFGTIVDAGNALGEEVEHYGGVETGYDRGG